MRKEDPVKTCVQYDDHCKLMCTVLCSLMEHQSLVDLAIRCGNNTMHAHKCILAASSPYFREQLEKNPGTEQVIINGLDFATMKSVVEFIYCGETNILEENMKYVIAAAKLFQIRGLQALADGGACDAAENQIYIPAPVFINKKPKYSNPYVPFVSNSSETLHPSSCNEPINDPNAMQVQVIQDSTEKTDDKSNNSFYDDPGTNVEILYTTEVGQFVTVSDNVLSNLSERTVQFQIVNGDTSDTELKLLDDKLNKSEPEDDEKCENPTSEYECQNITNNYECQDLTKAYERQQLDNSFESETIVNTFDCENLQNGRNALIDPLNQTIDINDAVDTMLMKLRNDNQNISTEDNIFRSRSNVLNENNDNSSVTITESIKSELGNEDNFMDFVEEPVSFSLPGQIDAKDKKDAHEDEESLKKKSEEDAQKMVDVLTNLISPFHSGQNEYQQLLYDLQKSYNPDSTSTSANMPGPLGDDETDYDDSGMTLRGIDTLTTPYESLPLENNYTREGIVVYNDNIFGDSNYTSDYSTISPPHFDSSQFPLCQQLSGLDNIESVFTSQDYGARSVQRFDERESHFLRNKNPFLQHGSYKVSKDYKDKTLKKQKTITKEMNEGMSSLFKDLN